ncbi:hypothetical protein V6O07_15470, partial [Arthrospira platensis SPKY2]
MQRIERELRFPGAHRLLYVADAFRAGCSLDTVHDWSHIDPWFLAHIEELVQEEARVRAAGLDGLTRDRLWTLKRQSFSDVRLARLCGVKEPVIR